MDTTKTLNIYSCDLSVFTFKKVDRLLSQHRDTKKRTVVVIYWTADIYRMIEKYRMTYSHETFIECTVSYLTDRFDLLFQALSTTKQQQLLKQCNRLKTVHSQSDIITQLEYIFGPKLLEAYRRSGQNLKIEDSYFEKNTENQYQFSPLGLEQFEQVLSVKNIVYITKSSLLKLTYNRKEPWDHVLRKLFVNQLNVLPIYYQLQTVTPVIIGKYQLTKNLEQRLQIVTLLEEQAINYSLSSSSVDAIKLHLDANTEQIEEFISHLSLRVKPEDICLEPTCCIIECVLPLKTKEVAKWIKKSTRSKTIIYLGKTKANEHFFRYTYNKI